MIAQPLKTLAERLRAMSVLRVGASASALSLIVAGCSPSVSSNAPDNPFDHAILPGGYAAGSDGAQSGQSAEPHPRKGHGEVTLALIGGARLPEEVAQQFTAETGFTLSVVEVESAADLEHAHADVVAGLDATDAGSAASAGTIASTTPEDTRTPEGTELPQALAGVAYGRDDVCVIADSRWFSANALPLPTSLAELSAADAPKLSVPDPKVTSIGRSFTQSIGMATNGTVDDWVKNAQHALTVTPTAADAIRAWTGARVIPQAYWTRLALTPGIGAHDSPVPGDLGDTAASDKPALSTSEGDSAGHSSRAEEDAASPSSIPLVVAPRSLATLALNNSGSESVAAPIPATCVKRILYVASGPAASDGAESFIAWLSTRRTQRSLAVAGAIDPMNEDVRADTAAQWFLTADPSVGDLDSAAIEATATWGELWARGLAAH
ncbi:hypothetical protein G7Y41_08605 [Schaalia sp. ZJ405]|uniref:hypothetical protein n=1 Tax=Schaalia sp. ZJ405 TaxID=2709403 RepID=UPI0013EC7EE6|nr:hypothetical protein [Schaalia sp. ZJ405]QPK81086.1 hypothetical protein G7Y41_08605 [Schaalia sp. ZJ405]